MVCAVIEIEKAFKDIKYYDIDHTYIDTSNNKKLISVTQVLGKIKEPFDEGKWLKIKAKERGITEEELKREWWVAGKIGTTRGTLLHKYMEDTFSRKEYPKNYGNLEHILTIIPLIEYIKSVDSIKEMADKFVKDHPNLIPIKSEVVIGSSEIGIAGMFDQLMYDENNDSYIIIDYKTDKDIKYSNRWSNLKEPLSKLEDCQYVKYSLQLSLYKYIIEKYTKIKISELKIIWFNSKNESYKIIPIEFLEDEILELIKYINNDIK